MNGIINILKPTGMTSHDVVSHIRKNFNIKKVGHTGTLDPNAAGVLPICIGKGTKLSQYIMEKTKNYRCEMIFGKITDTLDSYGQVVDEHELKPIELNCIEDTIKNYIGEIVQIPPAYSAIKVNGVRLYEKARKGEEIDDIPSRKVMIYDIKLIKYSYPRLMIDITCSSGTYIRSLVRDIAKDMDCLAYMSLLIRTKSGEFEIEDSITLEELAIQGIEKNLLPISKVKLNMDDVVIKASDVVAYINGCELSTKGILTDVDNTISNKVRVFDDSHRFLGIGIMKQKESSTYLKSDSLFI